MVFINLCTSKIKWLQLETRCGKFCKPVVICLSIRDFEGLTKAYMITTINFVKNLMCIVWKLPKKNKKQNTSTSRKITLNLRRIFESTRRKGIDHPLENREAKFLIFIKLNLNI